MDRITTPPPPASDLITPALAWAARNLSSLARLTASGIDGGDRDGLHLAATLALLRARQDVREGLRELARMEVAL